MMPGNFEGLAHAGARMFHVTNERQGGAAIAATAVAATISAIILARPSTNHPPPHPSNGPPPHQLPFPSYMYGTVRQLCSGRLHRALSGYLVYEVMPNVEVMSIGEPLRSAGSSAMWKTCSVPQCLANSGSDRSSLPDKDTLAKVDICSIGSIETIVSCLIRAQCSCNTGTFAPFQRFSLLQR